MKKILSLVLAMLMVFSVVPAVFAAETATAVSEDAHQDALDFLTQIGVYHGGQAASDKLERWHMALFVARFITGKTEDAYWATAENDSGFADVQQYVEKGELYKVGAISFAAQQGIINGYGDGNFGPADGITYRDALVMVVRALGTNYETYPWPYLNTAEQWGLTAGLEGIGLTDTLTRAQVAQILYNALFVEIKDETVAEKVFGVASDVVIITASNEVALDEVTAPVLRDGYIQFAELDEEGRPSGAKYHVPASVLGLTDANAAVGTTYLVTHLNNYANIIGYKSLNETYTNDGYTKQISAEYIEDEELYTITLGTTDKAYVVDEYTKLNNLQGVNQYKGLREVKVFAADSDANVTIGNIGETYYMDEQGYIYDYTTMTLVAYYSVFFGRFYSATRDNVHGAITLGQLNSQLAEEIVEDLIVALTDNQYTQTLTPVATAYAKAIASDINYDGQYDRVMLRNYTFGTIKHDGSKITTLTAGVDDGTFATVAAATGVKFADLRVTGIQSAKITKNKDAYVLYYFDAENAELDILEVIGYAGTVNKADGKDTYVARGYLLGFHQTTNLLYINDGGAADGANKVNSYKLGYSDLLGHTISEFKDELDEDYGVANKAYNKALIEALLALQNKYVEFVVVDNKVVYINPTVVNVTSTGDIVVIDYFTNISENGVEAYAWSTVTDSYSVIKITEFEGWNIKGADWRDYYWNYLFSGIAGGTLPNITDYISALIPVKPHVLYRVVYNEGDEYNLAPAAPVYGDRTVQVANNVIYCHADTFTLKFADVTASDYWLFCEYEGTKSNITNVIAVSGPLANVTFGEAGHLVDVYKKNGNDYVLLGDSTAFAALDAWNALAANVTFMYYQELVGWYDQDFMYDGQGHYYGHWMTNVLTGEKEFVKYDIADMNAIKAAVTEDEIYAVYDGVLTLEAVNAPKTAANITAHMIATGAVKGETTTDAFVIADGTVDFVTDSTLATKVHGTIMQIAIDAVEQAIGIVNYDKVDNKGVPVDYILPENVTVKAMIEGEYVEFTAKQYASSSAVRALVKDLKDVTAYAVYDGVKVTIILEPIV